MHTLPRHGRPAIRSSFLLVSLLLVGLLQSAFAADPGFNMPRKELLAKVKRVGFLPFGFDREWPRNAAAAVELETLTTQLLAQAGIEAVPLAAYEEIESRIRQEDGGWFDPDTGRELAKKRAAIHEKTLAEYSTTHKLDGYVKVWVDVVKADLHKGTARWHGVVEPVESAYKRGAKQSINNFLDTSMGSISAVSISAALYNLEPGSKPIFSLYGGLQPLAMTRENGIKIEFVNVSDDFILSDPVRNSRALRLSLRPLLLTKEQMKAEDAAFARQRAAALESATDPTQMIGEDGRPLLTPVTVDRKAATDALPALRLPLADLALRAGTIALAPVSIDVGRPLADRNEKVETALARGLGEAGFKVVPSSVYREVYLRHRATHGPYFDAISGVRLQEHADALNAAVFDELKTQHAAGAIAYPLVLPVMASHDGKKLYWDGVSQSIVQDGSVLAGIAALSTTSSGTALAMSLRLRITGPTEETWFLKQTGVQGLQRVSGGMTASRMVDVKDEYLLTDDKVDPAIRILMEELRAPAPAN